MSEKKRFLLRLEPDLYAALERWAADELRSVNGQIEFLLKEAARKKVPVVLTSDHGSIHCTTPATVFAKRDATQNLRYKFGEDLRAGDAVADVEAHRADRRVAAHVAGE